MTPRQQEFERLVAHHSKVMSAAVRRVCGRRHRALIPDIEQEIYLALWKRLEGGNEIRHPTSYLYKMALTTALALVRRTQITSPKVEEEPAAAPENPDRGRLIEQVLATLEPDQSRALRAYLAGFNHREVARLFGWTESVARHRIYRSIEVLKQTVGESSHHG